ncbi:hypothetical protein ARMGADRAFT_1079339 [Armillaria gallica]|uniref:Uncharacterized protein n=1 Tax=Armillaria gallica TaxID=47427 RepID=A0A2H3DQU4_ARMGA|nr:hypothetical protein ARMGADRAFT_1079339 [Armillaria gallica]
MVIYKGSKPTTTLQTHGLSKLLVSKTVIEGGLGKVLNYSELKEGATLELISYNPCSSNGYYQLPTVAATLALEHPFQAWDIYLELAAPELLYLMVSVRSAPTDFYHIEAFFNKLEAPKLNTLAFHIHVLPISDDYSLGKTLLHLEDLATCIIRYYNRLLKVTIHWHSYRDTVTVELYSAAFSASFETKASASHCEMKLLMEKTNYSHEMF